MKRYATKMVDGKQYYTHRLIYKAHKGIIPDGAVIHHVNGDITDNSIDNLELIQSNGEHIRSKHSALIDIPKMNLSSDDLSFIKSHIAVDRIMTYPQN